MKLIKFSNGKWGIRKGLIFYKYYLTETQIWLSKNHEYFSYCMYSENEARMEYLVLKEDEARKKIKIKDEVID